MGFCPGTCMDGILPGNLDGNWVLPGPHLDEVLPRHQDGEDAGKT